MCRQSLYDCTCHMGGTLRAILKSGSKAYLVYEHFEVEVGSCALPMTRTRSICTRADSKTEALLVVFAEHCEDDSHVDTGVWSGYKALTLLATSTKSRRRRKPMSTRKHVRVRKAWSAPVTGAYAQGVERKWLHTVQNYVARNEIRCI